MVPTTSSKKRQVSSLAAGEVAARRQSFKLLALSTVAVDVLSKWRNNSQQANLGFHAKEKYSTGLKLLLPNTIYPNRNEASTVFVVVVGGGWLLQFMCHSHNQFCFNCQDYINIL
jgi:hypothetical protein